MLSHGVRKCECEQAEMLQYLRFFDLKIFSIENIVRIFSI